jgi:hypothetical protein
MVGNSTSFSSGRAVRSRAMTLATISGVTGSI